LRDASHFSTAGLASAVEETIQNLASSSGLLLKSLVPHDPTGEMLRVIDQVSKTEGPRTDDGVWTSADGARTLLVAQTAAAGSDTDAQQRAIEGIRGAFREALNEAGPAAAGVSIRLSGPGVFAVAARDNIKRAAMRLSAISSVLVIGILLAVYRSMIALGLGLLPVATGALVGIAAVALGFGAVHGITLGFGITLIGESVDYSIYFFIQSAGNAGRGNSAVAWKDQVWPTIRLGMLTSVCGFASLLPSGFPGLAQLGLYSISGLIAAALVTRYVLPELVPAHLRLRDVEPLGRAIGKIRDRVLGCGRPFITGTAAVIVVTASLVLCVHRATVWNHELSALSPVSLDEQQYDAQLRADLGAANVLDIVVISGPSLDAVLRGAERAGKVLRGLIGAGVIGDFDSPANYLPSLETQAARRASLPDPSRLRANLTAALAGSDLKEDQVAPFLTDVEAARHGPLLSADDLRGTSLAAGFAALVLHQGAGWNALLPLHAPAAAAASPDIDAGRIAAALRAAHLNDAQVLDLKTQTDALYAGYVQEALKLSLTGLALLIVLLLVALRSALRVARIMAPLLLAVLSVAAGLIAVGQQLNLLHLVGMLLIVAVGSNYALFFDKEAAGRPGDAPLTLASLVIANLSTVIAFGLLAFSQVPVLTALGGTVAPGAFLALI
jgi:predicted exporter